MASRQRPRSGGPPGRITKAERKEQARRERIELERRMARGRRNRTIAGIAGVVVGLAIVAAVALTSGDGGESKQPQLPGLMVGAEPWPANLETLGPRLDRLDLPPFSNPLALHVHSHLDLFVNGASVPVPADIGWGADVQSPLHTHDGSGVIHLESGDADARFRLGEFFDVWGLRLTPSCIGGYCNAGGATLHVFVNDEPYQGNPRDIELTDQEEIVIAYGTRADVPDPLPTFDWSQLQP